MLVLTFLFVLLLCEAKVLVRVHQLLLNLAKLVFEMILLLSEISNQHS